MVVTVPGGGNLDRAVDLLNAGIMDQAASAARDYLAEHPDSAAALLILASALQADDPAQAADAARRSLAIDPNSALAWSEYGRALGRLDKHKEAVAAASRAIELAPDNWQYHMRLANALLPTDPRRAIAAAKQAVNMAPEESLTHFCLGNAYAARDRWQDARMQYEAALKIRPELVEARHNLALVELRLGKTRRAMGLSLGVLRERPDLNDAQRPFLVAQLWSITAVMVWSMAVVVVSLVLQVLWTRLPSRHLAILIVVGVACLALLGVVVAARLRRLSGLGRRAAWKLLTGVWWSRVIYIASISLPLSMLAVAFAWHGVVPIVVTSAALVAQVVSWVILLPWVGRKLTSQAGLPVPKTNAEPTPSAKGRLELVSIVMIVVIAVVLMVTSGNSGSTHPVSRLPSWYTQIPISSFQTAPVPMHFGDAYSCAGKMSITVTPPASFTPSNSAEGVIPGQVPVELVLSSKILSPGPTIAVFYDAKVVSGGEPGQPITDTPRGTIPAKYIRGDVDSTTLLAFSVVNPEDITLTLTLSGYMTLIQLIYTLA